MAIACIPAVNIKAADIRYTVIGQADKGPRIQRNLSRHCIVKSIWGCLFADSVKARSTDNKGWKCRKNSVVFYINNTGPTGLPRGFHPHADSIRVFVQNFCRKFQYIFRLTATGEIDGAPFITDTGCQLQGVTKYFSLEPMIRWIKIVLKEKLNLIFLQQNFIFYIVIIERKRKRSRIIRTTDGIASTST